MGRLRRVTKDALGVCLCLTAALGAPSAAASDTAAQLVPHRAVYELSLAKSKSGGTSVTAARGRMEFEWSDVCDGWSVRQRSRILVTHADGGDVDFGWTLTSWEAKDGLSYRFFLRRLYGSGEDETVRGEAQLDGPGLGGLATYSEPEDKTVKLPKGTVFPTQHNLLVVEAAEAGDLPLWRMVFDGSGDDSGLYGVNVALASSEPPDTTTTLETPLLRESPSWRLLIAYFDPEDETAPPDYEQQLRLFANGVVDELLLDYGEFSIDAELTELVPLPAPDC